jgi:hypothetical protein
VSAPKLAKIHQNWPVHSDSFFSDVEWIKQPMQLVRLKLPSIPASFIFRHAKSHRFAMQNNFGKNPAALQDPYSGGASAYPAHRENMSIIGILQSCSLLKSLKAGRLVRPHILLARTCVTFQLVRCLHKSYTQEYFLDSEWLVSFPACPWPLQSGMEGSTRAWPAEGGVHSVFHT